MDVFGQIVGALGPVFLFCVPAKNAVTDQFTNSIIVDIAQEPPPIIWFVDFGGEPLEVALNILFNINREPALGAFA